MRICMLGATGLVGHETLELIGRAWPGAELALFASRDRTAVIGGTSYEVRAADKIEASDAPRGDLAMVALDDEYSRRFVPRLLELGYRVVDKSNTFRMDPEVVLGVGGVNCASVDDDVHLVANPNCTTIPFTLAVAPLQKRWGLESASVSSYQAISGAGTGPLDEFIAASAMGYAEANRLGTNFDPGAYAANCVPHNGKTDESGFSSEERKLVNESRKILAQDDFAVCAQCCRIPVAVGHYENAWVTLREPASIEEIEAVLADQTASPFVRLVKGSAGEGLSALATVHDRDRALVGRIRKDPRDSSGRTVCMTVVADNLRLGAATNAVRVASRWFPSADPELQAPGH
jgi:aspartate-semialdehyde dehydrogenase